MSAKNAGLVNGVMCHCSGTKREQIQGLFDEGMDMNAISRWTGALSGCGGCEWDIAQLLKELAEHRGRINEDAG
ncbi:MAG: (2Fe-2S)-binding protein [Nitrosomonadales bacterium]|nr:(2Fe-2S)-binding protein [Nitrosomonadales bacterium]